MNEQQQQQLAREWIGHDAIDENGTKIGAIAEIYLDDDSGQPEWVAIKTGWFGQKLSFAPIAGATAVGEDMCLPFSKDKVKHAPKVDPDGHLEASDEDELYRYYDMAGFTGRGEQSVQDEQAVRAAQEETGGTGDMIRAEEQLDVDRVTRERGRARLRKYVVTEDVTMTVPVRREEVRVVREPIREGERTAGTTRDDLGEQEQEVVLHEEELQTHKTVVPKERVRMEKDVTTEEREVSEKLRKEKIDLDRGDSTPTRP